MIYFLEGLIEGMDDGHLNVLLIEDDPQDAQLMQEALGETANTSFALEWVDRVSKGLERLARGGIDLVLTDLQLPDSQGLETVARVHAQAEGVPIIVLTALDDEGMAIQALQKGVQDYLVKRYIKVYPNLLVRSMRYAIERRRGEGELIRLASFLEQCPDPVLETDGSGVITYLNRAARTQFADLFGSAATHPVLWGLKDAAQRLQRSGATSLTREVPYRGKTYEQHISYYPQSDLIRSYLIDVTERKQMEQRERELAAAAAAAERKRAAELDEAYQELKRTQAMLIQAEKMAAVGQLASGIAHEVRNPLGIILQCVNYLEPDLQSRGAQHAEVLQVIREAVMTSDKIIRGLLDFSRPTPLELKPTSIASVIDASLALVQAQAAEKGIRLMKDVADDVPLVLLDEHQMQQVLINLILNAFAAMPTGGRLSIRSYLRRLTEPGLRIGLRSADAFRPGQTVLVCEVEDTGTGIPKEILPRVFHPFFTTKPPGEGIGLGLTITAAIVEGHGGTISLESEEGNGTKAVITLPVSQDRDRNGEGSASR
ncbi:MAG: response regulator [Candidatus Omnitrophica bacterium]|nr:response regulator [Candidatus Omnitrophota bacterium]MBI3021956.1 response regulator [Candidatus Omnitrophota bacterium]